MLEQLVEEVSPWALALPGLSCLAVGGVAADASPVAAAWAALDRAAHIFDAIQDAQNILGEELASPATAISLATGLSVTAFHFLGYVTTYPGAARVLAVFLEAAFRSSLGQYLDLTQSYDTVSVSEALEAYWHMVIHKSGSLFRMATAGGAAVGTNSEALIAALGEFGNCIGVILQVLDDCRDVLDDPDPTKCEMTLPLLLLSAASQQDVTASGSESPLSREALFRTLDEADVPAVITDVLLEWRRRALDSLTPVKRSEAVTTLEGILDHILTSVPLPG